MQHHLDPEESHEIVKSYQGAAAAVERFGGRVAKFLGDGVMAYFGYPPAHDNDAERAVAGALHCKLRAPKEAEKLAARAIRLDETGWSILGQGSRIHLGWARAQQGHAAEGVELIRQGLKGNRFEGQPQRHLEKTEYFTWLAEALALHGAIDDAFRMVEEALAANPEELVNRPEAFRVRGELRLSVGQRDLAETDFHEAITLAQKIDAKAWELRSTTSLARLLRDTNRRDEARAMHAQIYDWFTEGFDTADLKDAKALLGELGSNARTRAIRFYLNHRHKSP